jgi:hypothetical protein
METIDFGIVYVLTNPVMPGILKIGMTQRNDIEARLRELYTTGVPVPFECCYACKVPKSDCMKIEQALHRAFAPQRINENREFFKLDTEQVVSILMLFNHEDATEEVRTEMDSNLTEADREAVDRIHAKRPRLNFEDMGIPVGAKLMFRDNPEIEVEVVDSRHVRYLDDVSTLTPITMSILGKSTAIQPTPYWIFKNRNLMDIYDDTYPIAD